MQVIEHPYDYPYCDFEFMDWNPVQRKCAPHFTEDCNLVVSASTASGKTVIAEAVMGYELSRSDSSKVVYISPLKAIGIEKYDAWSNHSTFGKFAKCLISSDTDVSISEIEKSRVIVSTVESMDIKCRSRERWIRDVKALVFDEAHLIGDESRGAGSEALVMAFTALNPGCRVIFLSGTMSNFLEIAKWLKNCNGKATRYVNSSWRPQELIKRVVCFEGIDEEKKDVLEMAREVHADDRKMLVFVHSKRIGEEITRHLREFGVPCEFYNAGISGKAKERMLCDFRNGYSGLNVLVCTSSLGMGVTL